MVEMVENRTNKFVLKVGRTPVDKLKNGNSGQCFIIEALSAIFMPKIEYRATLLNDEKRFIYQSESVKGELLCLYRIRSSC